MQFFAIQCVLAMCLSLAINPLWSSEPTDLDHKTAWQSVVNLAVWIYRQKPDPNDDELTSATNQLVKQIEEDKRLRGHHFTIPEACLWHRLELPTPHGSTCPDPIILYDTSINHLRYTLHEVRHGMSQDLFATCRRNFWFCFSQAESYIYDSRNCYTPNDPRMLYFASSMVEFYLLSLYLRDNAKCNEELSFLPVMAKELAEMGKKLADWPTRYPDDLPIWRKDESLESAFSRYDWHNVYKPQPKSEFVSSLEDAFPKNKPTEANEPNVGSPEKDSFEALCQQFTTFTKGAFLQFAIEDESIDKDARKNQELDTARKEIHKKFIDVIRTAQSLDRQSMLDAGKLSKIHQIEELLVKWQENYPRALAFWTNNQCRFHTILSWFGLQYNWQYPESPTPRKGQR